MMLWSGSDANAISTRLVLLALLLVWGARHAAAEGPPILRGASVMAEGVAPHVFDSDLRDLPPEPSWRWGEAVKEIPKGVARPGAFVPPPPPANPTHWIRDSLLETSSFTANTRAASAAQVIALNIPGQPFSGVIPPDTVGDVGKEHYIQAVNNPLGTRVLILDKRTGARLTQFKLGRLGAGRCAEGLGDPIVLYDRLADRWLLSEFANAYDPAAGFLCIYISRTDNPVSGGWYHYGFKTKNFPDYPKYAVWPNAYYITTNEANRADIVKPSVYALDRARMLTGGTVSLLRRTVPALSAFPFQALTASNFSGSQPPPETAEITLIRHRDDEVHDPGANDPEHDFLELWSFRPNFITPPNSVLTGPQRIAIPEIDSDLCGLVEYACIPQPGTRRRLDPMREIVMWQLQYRNEGDVQTLMGNLVTDVDHSDHAGIRWFELYRKGTHPWRLYQTGTLSPDEHHRWMGSIAKNGMGTIALGYSIASKSLYPSLRVTHRTAADPPGTLRTPEITLIKGSGAGTSNRWGDYSAMTVDPVDDCTFWYTSEFTRRDGTWDTRIGKLRFDACAGE